MASTSLEFTPASAGDQTKWTWSGWIKRSDVETGSQVFFNGYDSGSNETRMYFSSSETLNFTNYLSSSADGEYVTNRLFRDPGAWYHLVFAWDSDNATPGDRIRIYVNGVEETSFSTENNPSSGSASIINKDEPQYLGKSGSGQYFDGLMAHVHFCDGQAYAASDFGEFDATSGIWVAKSGPSVTYGTNGFFLKFQDTAAFGDDSSGNGNDFTVSGTMTQTKDTPDSNFATWSTLYQPHTGVHATFSNGNTTCISQNGSGDYWGSASTLGMVSGKWYAEFKAVTASNKPSFGIVQAPAQHQYNEVWIGNLLYDYAYVADGTTYNDNSLGSGTWNTFTAGDIIGVAVDLTNLKIYFSKNGVWENSGDPTSGATGTGSAFTLTSIAASTVGIPTSDLVECGGSYHFACSDQSTAGDTMSANFGNGYFQTTAVSSPGTHKDDAGLGDFEYDVPAGYYALCTTNLGDQS